SGCSIHAVDPHPTVVVGANSAKIRLDATAIGDAQKLDGTWYTIEEVKKSLENGLANLAGEKYGPGAKDSMVLKITQLQFGINHALGNFISARYRAKWIGADGQQIAEVAGVAKPRNPFESSPKRHLEDVIEVMYENMVNGYDKATHPNAPSRD